MARLEKIGFAIGVWGFIFSAVYGAVVLFGLDSPDNPKLLTPILVVTGVVISMVVSSLKWE